jgi:sigma-70-like protein
MASVDESALADVESFVALYREHAEGLLAFFARRTLDGEAAADLAAETFAQALASRQRFRDHGEGAGPWLYAIASHQLAHYYRRGRASAKARERLGMPARAELSQEDLQRIEELIDLGAVAGEVRTRHGRAPRKLARRRGAAHRRGAAVLRNRGRAWLHRAGRSTARESRSAASRHHDPGHRGLTK